MVLRQYEKNPLKISGDDIMMYIPSDSENPLNEADEKKVSVSITKTLSNNVTVGHLGINIFAGKKAPEFAGNISSLENEETLKEFIQQVEYMFYSTINSCFIATTKVV